MLRRLKKFAVCSSVIVAGQASRALDDAPFAGQDESEDAKGLLRRLSECEDASYVQIFDQCIDPLTTKLDLWNNGITGPIPTEIGLLTALKKLDLGYNMFSTIPTEIGMLTALKYLDLYYNEITGPLPTEFGLLTALTFVSLDYNEIDTIPTEIGELTALEGLYLDSNKINGPIPTEIGQLTALEELYLNKNKITGTFPLALCDVEYCNAESGNDLVAPCGTKGCCDLKKGKTCSKSKTPKCKKLKTKDECKANKKTCEWKKDKCKDKPSKSKTPKCKKLKTEDECKANKKTCKWKGDKCKDK